MKRIFKKTKNKAVRFKEMLTDLKEGQEYDEKHRAKQIKHVPFPFKAKKEAQRIEISLWNVFKIGLVVIGIFLIYQFLEKIAATLLLLFISAFLAAAFDPMVDYFEEKKVPRTISFLIMIVVGLAVISIFITQIVPVVAIQMKTLANNLPDLVAALTSPDATYPLHGMIQPFSEQVFNNMDLTSLTSTIESFGLELESVGAGAFDFLMVAFSGMLNLIIVLVLTFFMVVDEHLIDDFILSVFPAKYGKYIVYRMTTIKSKMGEWLRGQIALMIIVGAIFYVVMELIGVDYALTLGMLAGFMELVPVAGPFIFLIPALLIAFNQAPILALWVLIATFILQQLEGNVLVPMIMNKSVGLHPLIVIIALLVGFSLLGVVGVLLAVPVAAALSIFVKDITHHVNSLEK